VAARFRLSIKYCSTRDQLFAGAAFFVQQRCKTISKFFFEYRLPGRQRPSLTTFLPPQPHPTAKQTAPDPLRKHAFSA
jgi:hypothetical protein